MKATSATAIASLLLVSLGAGAHAQTTKPGPQAMLQATPQHQVPPQQPMPPAASAREQVPSSSGQRRISGQIKEALINSGVTATHVNVSFSAGTATLTGSVFAKADIAKAKMAAMRVPGVQQVDATNLHSRTARGKG